MVVKVDLNLRFVWLLRFLQTLLDDLKLSSFREMSTKVECVLRVGEEHFGTQADLRSKVFLFY